MEGLDFTKQEIDELSSFSTEVMSILKRNDEHYTENKNGYIFDILQLTQKTRSELKDLHKNIAQPVIHGERTSSSSVIQNKAAVKDTAIDEDITKTVFSVSPKFQSEYNTDYQKLTAKPASLMKFLNAKKKYLRSSDNTLFTKINLEKENY